MKTRICLMIFIIGLILSILGCQSEVKLNANSLVKKEDSVNTITAAVSDPRTSEYKTKLSEFSFDLDSDGDEENIELYTEAGRLENGELVWDDGQRWLLVAIDENKYYTLFADYVQLGDVYFDLCTIGEERIPNVTVMIRTGSRIKVIEFTFNKDKESFQQEAVYESNNRNSFFTSIPSYR